MQLYHNSQQMAYRNPFGAVTLGTKIELGLLILGAAKVMGVNLCLYSGEDGARKIAMNLEHSTNRGTLYKVVIEAPHKPQLLWYSFEVCLPNQCVYYGNREDQLGGEGKVYMTGNPPCFQITVYKERLVPEWYKNAIAYQIFPDRFCRGSDFVLRTANSMKEERKGLHHILRQEWDDKPEYKKNEKGEVTHWDFFGGTLKGIEEKLDYLEQLGVSVIYLNPIFEASSNHRYDTADYMKIDKRLGDDEAFRSLAKKAEEKGISIILDGVFNHSGNDSVYFDQFKNYGDGAYDNVTSKYASWYRFTNKEHTDYDCWWGTRDLPNFDKESKAYQDFIYGGTDSVIKHWLRLGAKGWRLDVADELTDRFIAGIKQAILEEQEDGILLGEVWEDASNKVSYGNLRSYLLGDELDSVMNYPLRDILIGYLKGAYSVATAVRRLMSLYENYPRENFYAAFNMIGSHDRVRILSLLGKEMEAEHVRDDSGTYFHLSDEERYIAKKRLRLLVLMQMTHPGVPCIYYGDEAGMEGGADPYNRGTYPWEKENTEIKELYQTAIALRKEYDVFVDGSFEPFSIGEDVYGYRRKSEKEHMIVLMNRCPYHEVVATVDTDGCEVLDLLTAKRVKPDIDGNVTVTLESFGAAILRVCKEEKLGCEFEKGAGVLCHLSSIHPMNQVDKFLDKIKNAGFSYWQILPLNPTDELGSPYSSYSAFAGNVDFVPKEENMVRDLDKEWKAFCSNEAYVSFCKENEYWLKDDCYYKAIKEQYPVPWQEWPAIYKNREPKMWEDETLKVRASYYAFCQYVFDCNWKNIRDCAREKQVKVIGDLPFYMREDSVDTWAHRELFHLDEDGYLTESAGVPPDYFSEEGQNWSVPTYNFTVMKQEGYEWWVMRMLQAAKRYDYVRLDHFRGFEQYYAIPKGYHAKQGHWMFGPGRELFLLAAEKLSPLPIIAEDLGQITATVNDLTDICGFVGMDVFQFSEQERYDTAGYHARENAILYSGTHDNETLKGWCDSNLKTDLDRMRILNDLYQSDAPVIIFPMQDILGLDNTARMNVPGTTVGNWKWKFLLEAFDEEKVKQFHELAIRYRRA